MDELETFFPEIIDSMPNEFDSHQFILVLAQSQQRLYVRFLARYADTDRPFQIAHGQIAGCLSKYPSLVAKVGEHNSADIFGQVNSAVVWRKVK